MVNCSNLIVKMSPRFVLGRENVPCVAEAVNRSLKADCTDFTLSFMKKKVEFKGPPGFMVDCILSFNSHNSGNFRLIEKSKISKSNLGSRLSKAKSILEIKQKAFVLLLIKVQDLKNATDPDKLYIIGKGIYRRVWFILDMDKIFWFRDLTSDFREIVISNSYNINKLCIILKHAIWRLRIYNLFREIFKFRDCKKAFFEFREIYYCETNCIFWFSRSRVSKWYATCLYFKSVKFSELQKIA